jgi:hypothetical protein
MPLSVYANFMRNLEYIEGYFRAAKQNADSARLRVWDSDALRGRMIEGVKISCALKSKERAKQLPKAGNLLCGQDARVPRGRWSFPVHDVLSEVLLWQQFLLCKQMSDHPAPSGHPSKGGELVTETTPAPSGHPLLRRGRENVGAGAFSEGGGGEAAGGCGTGKPVPTNYKVQCTMYNWETGQRRRLRNRCSYAITGQRRRLRNRCSYAIIDRGIAAWRSGHSVKRGDAL